MKHRYSMQNDKLKILKIIVLAIALLFDFANIWVFISGIVERMWSRILQAVGVFLLLLLVRIGSTFLTCRYDYNFDENSLRISKVFPYFHPQPVYVEYDKIDSIQPLTSQKPQKAIWLCSKSCHFDLYVIEYQSKNYVIALDEYGYCMLNRCTNDIF